MIGTSRRLLILFASFFLASDLRSENLGCAAAPACAPPLVVAQAGAARSRLAAATDDVLPSPPAAPAAKLSSQTVSASLDGEAILEVDAPGRFAIRAESRTGVALQLVDMIGGPGDVAGEAGVRDGRLDVLLDKGRYKIRRFGAPGAQGDATLVVRPFRDAEAASAALLRGGTLDGELGDLEQRSYWVLVGEAGRISVEAVGRALADLRLWRNGRDLIDLMPALGAVEPKAGHPLTRARLDGAVVPGLYLVTAYGGLPLPWADGETINPFHVRAGPPQSLTAGLLEGVIGPFGSSVFEAPPAATHVRVELPDPAPLRLTAARGTAPPQAAMIARNSREPLALVNLSAGRDPIRIEVAGSEGQAFRLRAMRPAASLRLDGAGPHLISVDVAGEGGDEIPATVVLARFDQNRTGTVLASSALRIGPGQAFRRKFNLRGSSSLLLEVAAAGPLTVTTEGPGVRVALEPLVGNTAPRADGKLPQTFDVEPGWYVLKLEPVKDAVGILDLTVGQPGLRPDPAAPSPARTTIPLGLFDLAKTSRYQVFVNSAPGLVAGPAARAVPVDLGSAPFTVLQTKAAPQPVSPQPAPPQPAPTNQRPIREQGPQARPAVPLPQPAPSRPQAAAAPPFDLPVRAPQGGTISITEASGAPVEFSVLNEAADKDDRTLILRIAPVDRSRLLVLSWSRAAPREPVPPIASDGDLEILRAGQTKFFDLRRDEQKSFRLDVGEGGLHRIETLGRLKTSATIATPFLPKLDRASDNGPGHNALLQTYLRAGTYRVDVSASDSNGRLGLVAAPAPLIDAALLVPGGSSRASLAEGRGAIFPIEIAEAGTYRLDLYGLGRTLAARLEDAGGWPLTPPGELAKLERKLAAGRYRLVVLPQAVDARVVARLRRIVPPTEPEGHGPHTIAFDAVQKFQWREPAAKDAERIPDRWQFALQGPADIVLEVSDGMIADLIRTDGEARSVAKIIYKRGFSGALPAGRYVIEAKSLGRNDRLDYELTLRSKDLQPGTARFVELPVTVPFAIAEDRVVSITSFGRTDFGAVLKEESGRVVERLSGRADDWNIGLSRRLPAGKYQLELTKSSAKGRDNPETRSEDDNESAPAGEESTREAPGAVELLLDLPAPAPVAELPLFGSKQVSGPQVHQFALPAIDAGHLLVVAAQSSAELVVSLERQDASGRWRAIGFDRDKSPVVAVPADGDAGRPWRLAVWAIDGGVAPITLAARGVRQPAQPAGRVTLAPVGIDGLPPVGVALVATPSAGLVVLGDRVSGLRQGSAPGRALAAADAGVLAPQSEQLWLIARNAAEALVSIAAKPAAAGEIALTLAEGDRATLVQDAVPRDHLRVWRADSAFGQPGLDGGRRMGVAPGSALALAGTGKLTVWNAAGGEPLRVRLTSADVALRPIVAVDTQLIVGLAPRSAQPLRLAGDRRQVQINLAAGTAAVATASDGRTLTVWSGNEALTRTFGGEFSDVVLINPGDQPAPVSLALAPAAQETEKLASGQALKRFFGAAGSLSLTVDASSGDRLVVAGATATFVGDDGAVMRGSSLPLSGPGELTVDHEAGLVAVWVERDGKSPWPVAAPAAIAAPAVVRLEGQAMTFALDQQAPVLIHARTNAPVIVSLRQGNAGGEPILFPAGAELHRYIAAGPAELRLYSPHDGPLAGSLELTATPIVQVAEGLGDLQPLAPGATALFGFEVTRATTVGVGVRSEPDRAMVRLLDATGRSFGEGVAQLARLEPGRYLIEARAPADGRPLVVRAAVIGIAPRPAGPPPDVAAQYLEMVGLTPSGTR